MYGYVTYSDSDDKTCSTCYICDLCDACLLTLRFCHILFELRAGHSLCKLLSSVCGTVGTVCTIYVKFVRHRHGVIMIVCKF